MTKEPGHLPPPPFDLGHLDDPAGVLRGLFAQSPVPYIIFGADGHPLVTNHAYREMFGAQPPPEYNVLKDEVIERLGLTALVRRAFQGEALETPVFWYDPKELGHIRVTDAKRVAIACSFFPLGGQPGTPRQIAVAYKDVTAEYQARARAESERDRFRAAAHEKERLAQALRESEERLRDTLAAAEVGTWEWNIPANRVTWSPNIESIFGLAPGSFAGTYEAWLALVHPDDREAIQKQVAKAIEQGTHYEAELRFNRPDGSTGWQHTRGYVVTDDDGRPKLFRGIVLDVTARRVAEEALKVPARVLESMAEGVSLSDENGVILYTNPAEDRMFGYQRGELNGQHVTVQNAYGPEENQRVVAEVIAQLRAHGQWSGEWRNRKKDGTPFNTRSHITSVELDGKPHWVCVQGDITEQVEARARAESLADALRESEARYRAFVSQSSEGIWRIEVEAPVPVDMPVPAQIDLFYQVAYLAECNDAMAKMYGYERAEELTGKRLGDLLLREDPRNHAYLSAFIESGYRLEGVESRERDRHGNLRVFQNSLIGILEDQHLRRAWGIQRDITWEVQARDEAEAASRSKDEFLAMLGHELRNPLSPILTALELMKLRDSSAFSKERAIIERQVRHVVRLVDDLLDVSRMTRGKISLDRRPVDLADAVAAGIELASPLLEQRAHRLSVHVPRGLVVNGDPTRLGQV
ncbi:MAG TPA: PAS domain S-box protein, partial [Polyangia bacterium]